jgi:hypothetical protein
MPTKVSERSLVASIALFATAITLLFNAKFFDAPVRISEKGIALIALGILLFLFSIRLLRKAVVRF